MLETRRKVKKEKYTIFRISFILNTAYVNLDFKIKIVEISSKLSEIHYFKVEHSKFSKPNLVIFEQSILQIFAKHSNDLHNNYL